MPRPAPYQGESLPTLQNALETIQFKIRQYGKDAHCTPIVVAEEERKKRVENKPDEEGRQKTKIAFETYSPDSYSAWHATFEYLLERCGFNPLIVVDVLLLLVQEARGQTEGEGVDGLEIAKQSLFKLRNYPEELEKAKTEWRARRRKLHAKPTT